MLRSLLFKTSFVCIRDLIHKKNETAEEMKKVFSHGDMCRASTTRESIKGAWISMLFGPTIPDEQRDAKISLAALVVQKGRTSKHTLQPSGTAGFTHFVVFYGGVPPASGCVRP